MTLQRKEGEQLLTKGAHLFDPSPVSLQEGFGWTNGVALQLLDLYGQQLTAASSLCSPSWPWIGACLILVLFSQLFGLLVDGSVQWEG